jgi:hypothetical protein
MELKVGAVTDQGRGSVKLHLVKLPHGHTFLDILKRECGLRPVTVFEAVNLELAPFRAR